MQHLARSCFDTGSIRGNRARHRFRQALGPEAALRIRRHGATLILYRVEWDEYERLLADLAERPHFRLSYDCGTLEVMTPRPEHEDDARFIDRLVGETSDALGLKLEMRGSATWKRRRLAKGVEPDACYYVGNAERIIGKRRLDLEVDPPPDIVVEIDITNESLRKFPIYAVLAVPEIWRYDGTKMYFYELDQAGYREVSKSRSFSGLTPALLAEALEHSEVAGQTAALGAFRRRWETR